MVEASTEQLTIVENFVTLVWDSLDPASVPDDLKTAYTEAVQVLGALIDGGQSQPQDQAVAAPA